MVLTELLQADDLVLCGESLNVVMDKCGESLNVVMDKYGRWKNVVKRKDLRVNVNKTKGMQLLFGKKSNVSNVGPCIVCGEQADCDSIPCTKYHRRFIVVLLMCLGRCLLSCSDVFVCRTSLGQ